VLALPGKLLARLLPHAGNVYAANVVENVPPFLLERVSPAELWHFKWFLALLALSLVLSAGRLLLSHLLLVVGFTVLALIGNRNVLLLYWMATPIVALNLEPAARRLVLSLRRLRGPMLARWVGRAALAALLVLAGTAAAREPRIDRPAPFRMPVESASIIESLPGTGSIFAADHYGGYLIWKLYPRFRPYIDTRLVLRSPEEFAEYLGIAGDPDRFDAFDRRHGFTYVVLPTAYPDRYLGLIAHLHASSEWKVIFTDGAETLFARRATSDDDGWDLGSKATTDRILAGADERFGGSAPLVGAARVHLASLDMVVGEYREAERILSETASPDGQALQARCRLASGDLRGAEELGQRLLMTDESDVRNLDLLAMVYARRGELREATSFLRRALAVDPFDGEAASILATMEQRAGEESHHEP
jgi:tetratricopeptide (TPR) repeat protein